MQRTGSRYGKRTSSYMALFYSSTQTAQENHQFSCVIETTGNPNWPAIDLYVYCQDIIANQWSLTVSLTNLLIIDQLSAQMDIPLSGLEEGKTNASVRGFMHMKNCKINVVWSLSGRLESTCLPVLQQVKAFLF